MHHDLTIPAVQASDVRPRSRRGLLGAVVAAALLTGALAPSSPAAAADGDPDTGFGTNGAVVTPVGSGNQVGQAVALAPDGKIVVAGANTSGGYTDTILLRYNPSGTLDTTFDVDGKVLVSLSTKTDRAYAVAVQPDGKIVIAGDLYDTGPGSLRMFVARYTSSGALDPTFATAGVRTVTLANAGTAAGYAISLMADGRIVVAGRADLDFAVVRLKSDGTYDTTLDGDGFASVSLDVGFDEVRDVALLADGKIMLAGTANVGPSSKLALARLNANGSLDTTFNTTGKVISALPGTSSSAGMVIQPDGKIVVAGSAGSPSNPLLARYTTAGVLDTTFNGSGTLRLTDRPLDYFSDLAIESDGKLLAVGVSRAPVPGEAAVTRVTPSGVVDTTYGTNGTTRIHNSSPSTFGSFGEASVLQLDGKLIVTGNHLLVSDSDVLVARLAPSVPGGGGSGGSGGGGGSGGSSSSSASGGSGSATGERLTVVPPTRVLDTRSGTKPTGGSVVRVITTAPAGARAVLVNLTMTRADAAGYITADRCSAFGPGLALPNKSNGNYSPGSDIANLNVVPVEADGSFCLYTSAPADLIVDLQGVYGPTGMLLITAPPTRVLDTRSGAKPTTGSITKVALGPVPGGRAVLVNLTMTGADGAGFVSADKCSALGTTPNNSNGNFQPGSDIANSSVVPLDADGGFCIYTSVASHLIVDIQGLYTDNLGVALNITTPTRVHDTRTGPQPGAGSITRVVTGAPSGSTSALINLTMTRAAGAGFVSADKCSVLGTAPNNSNGNLQPGSDIANTSVVPLDADGSFCLYTSAPVDLIVDLQGTY